MRARTILEYTLAAVVVLLLGALAGSYFFLRAQTQTTTAADVARGYNASAPFGVSGTNNQASSAGASSGTSPTVSGEPPQLWQVEQTPIAGMTFSTSTPIQVQYVESSSGYVFDADPQTGAVVRLTDTLMPKIYQALFTGGGHIIERSLDSSGAITTFVGSISTSTLASTSTPNTSVATTSIGMLSGVSLQAGIRSIATDPESDQLFYITSGPNGVSGVRSEWDGTKQKTIFTSPLSQWRPTWLADGRIIVLQAPADDLTGYAYVLQSNGTLSLVVSGPGLTVLPRASSPALLYGESSGNGLALFAQTSPSASAVQLPIHTLADKCVWAPGAALIAYCAVPQIAPTGNFLDNWYRGAVHTADVWWQVDVSAGTAQIIYTPDASMALDVEDPVIDAGGNYIAFINGADQSLWVLRITK